MEARADDITGAVGVPRFVSFAEPTEAAAAGTGGAVVEITANACENADAGQGAIVRVTVEGEITPLFRSSRPPGVVCVARRRVRQIRLGLYHR